MTDPHVARAEDAWNILRGGPADVSDDAKAISAYVENSYDVTENLSVPIFSKPEVIEDAISYAVMYFLREIGMRCHADNSQLPCVLTMASLSERFVPALFEQNLKKLYAPGSISRPPNILKDPRNVHEEKQSKFSTSLATMMIQVETLRAQQILGKHRIVGSLNTPITDKVFIPSSAEIIAAFRHVATFQESGGHVLPSDNISTGSSLLLIAISNALIVIPELKAATKVYYGKDRLTAEGFRRPANILLRDTDPLGIARDITPHLFAACCSHLIHIGKNYDSVSVDIGARGVVEPPRRRGNIPTPLVVPLGNTMLFHIGVLGADAANTRKAILKSFMNLASAWLTPQGRPFGIQRAATTEAARAAIQSRADQFFSILFAMIYSLMPTEETVIQEEKLIYENIFRGVPLHTQGGAVGKEAFEHYARERIGDKLHAFPTVPSLGVFLVTQKISDVEFLIRDREVVAGEGDPLSIILTPSEIAVVTNAMIAITQQGRTFPVIVGFEPMGEAVTTRPTEPSQLGVVEEGTEPISPRAEGQTTPRAEGHLPVEILMDFPVDAFDLAAVQKWDAAYAMSSELLESLEHFDDSFPFVRVFDEAVFTLPPEHGGKDKPIETPPKEILEEQRRKVDKLSEIIKNVFGIRQEQISDWFASGDLDVDDKEQMAAILALKKVLEDLAFKKDEELKEMKLEQKNLKTTQKSTVDELEKQLQECEDRTQSANNALETERVKMSDLNVLQEETIKELDQSNDRITQLETEITALAAGGTDVPTEVLSDLQEQLDECRADLEDVTDDRDATKKNESKLFILRAVVQQMADSEGNTALKDILKGKKGNLNDMYTYATAFGQKPGAFVKTLESSAFKPTATNKKTFAQGDKVRPSYSLTTGQVAEGKRKARENAARKKKSKSKTIRSAIPQQETTPRDVNVPHPAPSMASATTSRAETQATVGTKKATSLLGVLKQADARPSTKNMPSKAVKNTKPSFARRDRIRLKEEEEEEESAASILEHEGRISSRAFCESSFLPNTPSLSGMATSIDVKMQVFSGRNSLEEERSIHEITDTQEMVDVPQDDWGYYEEDIQGGSGDYYDHPEDKTYEDEDIAWPIQTSDSYTPKSDRYEVRHYGLPMAFTWKPHTFTNHHVLRKEKRDFGFAPKTQAPLSKEFKDQARCSVTTLVAGVLAIVSTRIYQATHTDPSQSVLHSNSSVQSKRKKRNNKKPSDALVLKQLTMPKKFDDSCRKANKESDTIPKAEQMILNEWNKLLCLSPSSRADGSKENLTRFVQELSYAIEHGNGKCAREAMISLCALVSFSKNVQVTMTNMVKEMHTATSRFRCTTNRNEMMECVRRSNGIKF